MDAPENSRCLWRLGRPSLSGETSRDGNDQGRSQAAGNRNDLASLQTVKLAKLLTAEGHALTFGSSARTSCNFRRIVSAVKGLVTKCLTPSSRSASNFG